MNISNQIKKITQGCVELISQVELTEKLQRAHKEKRSLRIKFGADPSCPDLHFGHSVLLRKLRDFQELGHQIIFIIGDFTACIGDPSGQSQTRKQLSEKEVYEYGRTYQKQAFKYLDPKKTKVEKNSSWLKKLSLREIVRIAASHTVARMIERDDFEKRFHLKQPIGIHEFLYPLMQGHDSVVVRADVEIGGTDQKFNLLVGRELQRQSGMEPQIVLTLPLLVGTDGVKKMSKSLGNHIGITEDANSIYGKTLSLSDTLATDYLKTLFPFEAPFDTRQPFVAKKRLARMMVEEVWGGKKGSEAERHFEATVQKKELPREISEWKIAKSEYKEGSIDILQVMFQSGLATSRGEARRLIQQSGVTLDGTQVSNTHALPIRDGQILKVGKRRYLRIRLK
jgi:tyrosyl-tRNA synthetase